MKPKFDKWNFDGHKLLYHMDRVYDHFRDGKHVAPIHIDLGITSACNSNCVYCYARHQKKYGEIMPRQVLLDLFSDAALIADSDEIIFRKDQEKILSIISDRRQLTGCADVACCKFVDYNGDLYHASPERPYLVPMAVAPSVRFTHIRSLDSNRVIQYPDVTVHHLGLVHTPELIKWKAGWEYKEEMHSQEELLDNWAVRREVTPPPELLELLDE